jgi:hypothetical protein
MAFLRAPRMGLIYSWSTVQMSSMGLNPESPTSGRFPTPLLPFGRCAYSPRIRGWPWLRVLPLWDEAIATGRNAAIWVAWAASRWKGRCCMTQMIGDERGLATVLVGTIGAISNDQMPDEHMR